MRLNRTLKKALPFLLFILLSARLLAQTTPIPEGSLIIDMGVVPQTVANGLKPYGLAYELINIRKISLLWAINNSKGKDGVDFTVDGREFRGGPFIVPKPYLADPQVQSTIASWEAKGVITYTTQSEVSVSIYREINIWPRWVLDQDNGGIAVKYLEEAEIPPSAYTIGLPSDLDSCDDLFILPHADPTWEDHGYLYTWNDALANGGNEGWIWSACHAVSVFEALVDPADPSRRMNFLASDPNPYPDPAHPGIAGYGLIDFGDHADGSGGGYLYDHAGDSFMQFLGVLDGATNNGSESIYLPYPSGSWRTSTQIAVWDPNQADVLSGDSPGRAAKLAYGHAFGDPNRGKVMYEAGHDLLNGTEQERVAAVRAFLNFSFDAPSNKAPILTDNTTVPITVEGGNSISFDVSTSSATGGSYTFLWSSTCPGSSFSGTVSTGNQTMTTFETTPVTEAVECLVTLQVIDACGREVVRTYGVQIIPPPTPPVAENDLSHTYDVDEVTLNALANDTDINFNIDPASFTTLSSLTVAGGTFTHYGNGVVGFLPNIGFTGQATLDYQICDDTPAEDGGPLCDTGTITIEVVPTPCGLNEPVSSETDHALSIYSSVNWANPDRALGAPDTNFSKSNSSVDGEVILDLGSVAYVGSDILFALFSDNGTLFSGTIDAASSPTGFPNNPLTVSVSTQDPATDKIPWTVTEGGIRYVRITGDKDFGLESVEFQRVICLPPPTPPVAADDLFATYDTNAISFDVLSNDTDINNNIDPGSFTPLTPLAVAGGTFVNLGNGQIRFEPDAGFTGSVALEYRICDDTPVSKGGPLCDTAILTVEILPSACGPGEYPVGTTSYALSVFSSVNWSNPDRALGAPDTNFSKSGNSVDGEVILDLGSVAYVGSDILFALFSDNGTLFSGTIDAAATPTGFPNAPISVSVSTQDPATEIIPWLVSEGGIRYVRVTGDKDFGLESVEFQGETCNTLPVLDTASDNFISNPIETTVGGVGGNVLINDTKDGMPVNYNELIVSLLDTGGLTGVTLTPEGNVEIQTGAPEGVYYLTYQICLQTHPSLCETAMASVYIVPDTDLDGIGDLTDADDDNDGITDLTESGGIDPGADDDLDGVPNYRDSDFSPLNAMSVSAALDTDGDGLPNHFDRDSDGDGCFDVKEAGFTDGDGDGILGDAPTTVNGSGRANGTNVTDGYTPPNDNNNNGNPDYLEPGQPPAIQASLTDQIGFVGGSVTFEVLSSHATDFQWQISTDNGLNFTDLVDGGQYSGSQSNILTVSGLQVNMTNYRYRVLVDNVAFICGIERTSSDAKLLVRLRSVITNRMITYRVNTN